MKAYRCDRCKKFYIACRGSKYSLMVYQKSMDLCSECLIELEEWVREKDTDTADDAQNAQE